MSKQQIRCAIYTRKSSEEGLEQSFNSLEAQREACQAFIASQKQEGWVALKTRYDDGGFSGGTMERPALKWLLDYVAAGKIGTVVVYKIDRLTRSLLDFSRIVEAFDAKGVTFVSVTQQFNTTTSMGRLTLNILLSFAQFEREVTGERIRDKFAASKKKGMWMGGIVPFGYIVDNRQLIVQAEEAELVREIYRQYLKLGHVTGLRTYLESRNLRGRSAKPFGRGALYHLLSNRIYIGEIAHRGQVYPGQHKAIIDVETWNAVAEKLRANNRAPGRHPRATAPSLLTGLVFDVAGVRYTPTHAVKRGKRYRYYTSQSVIQHKEPAGVGRIPASELEGLVIRRIQAFLTSPQELTRVLGIEGVDNLRSLVQIRVKEWSRLDSPGWVKLVKSVLRRVVLRPDSAELELSRRQLQAVLVGQERPSNSECENRGIRIVCDIQVRTYGCETRIISEHADRYDTFQSPSLIKAIVRARDWYARIVRGEVASLETLAKQNRVTSRYIRRVFRCASLSPEILEAVVNGQPMHFPFAKLKSRVPLDWSEQRGWISRS
jgi:DNA invertase Pin-like site-specific DNA recombinase